MGSPRRPERHEGEDRKWDLWVRGEWPERIIENVGSLKSKAYGYTKNNWPMFRITKHSEGWRLYALTFAFTSPGRPRKRDLYVPKISPLDGSKPEYYPRPGAPLLLVFDTKKEALDHVYASGSWGQEDRYGDGKSYYVLGKHLRGGRQDFKIPLSEKDEVWENARGGYHTRFVRVNSNRWTRDDGGVPQMRV